MDSFPPPKLTGTGQRKEENHPPMSPSPKLMSSLSGLTQSTKIPWLMEWKATKKLRRSTMDALPHLEFVCSSTKRMRNHPFLWFLAFCLLCNFPGRNMHEDQISRINFQWEWSSFLWKKGRVWTKLKCSDSRTWTREGFRNSRKNVVEAFHAGSFGLG